VWLSVWSRQLYDLHINSITYTCYFLFQIISFNKYFYVSLGNNFFYCFCGGPLVVEAPGQLPSLPPSLKSGLRRRRRRWPWRCSDGRMSGRVGRCRRWVGSRSGPTVSWHRAPAETSGGWRRPPGCERAGRSPQIAPRTARARPPPTVHHMRANDTIRYCTRCYFNVRSKANTSQLILPHGTNK